MGSGYTNKPILSNQSFMSAAADTTNNENVLTQKTGWPGVIFRG